MREEADIMEKGKDIKKEKSKHQVKICNESTNRYVYSHDVGKHYPSDVQK